MFPFSRKARIETNARMTLMFMSMAVSLFSTPESMASPCSVNAFGNLRVPPQLDVTICDFKLSNSSWVIWNMKSGGNRLAFRFTDWFSALVLTWYSSARSKSSMTCCPRIS